MLTEDQLYDEGGLFHQVIKQSAIMQGRYAVLPNGSRDLDNGNLLTGLELPATKYPLVACLPPVSFIDPSRPMWEMFAFRLLFLCKSGVSGDNQLKSRDPLTNTSLHRMSHDWADMKAVAVNFLSVLDSMQNRLRNEFILDERNQWRFVRVSNMQADKVSGVIAQFNCGIGNACDVSDIDVSKVELPIDNHLSHLH